jgi:hypothetical protein
VKVYFTHYCWHTLGENYWVKSRDFVPLTAFVADNPKLSQKAWEKLLVVSSRLLDPQGKGGGRAFSPILKRSKYQVFYNLYNVDVQQMSLRTTGKVVLFLQEQLIVQNDLKQAYCCTVNVRRTYLSNICYNEVTVSAN